MLTAGSRYYSRPVGITDSTALGGPLCVEENQEELFAIGHPLQRGVPEREEGEK